MIKIIKNSLTEHIVTKLRDKGTGSRCFRRNVYKMGQILTIEAVRDLKLDKVSIETPLNPTVGHRLSRDITVIPILRAGLPFAEAAYDLLDVARIGHLGLKRDHETLQCSEYYSNLPKKIMGSDVLIYDTILATAGTISKAIELVSKHKPASIGVVTILGHCQGLEKLQGKHPDVNIYVSEIDEKLTPEGYLDPGLGDSGDRIFDTL